MLLASRSGDEERAKSKTCRHTQLHITHVPAGQTIRRAHLVSLLVPLRPPGPFGRANFNVWT